MVYTYKDWTLYCSQVRLKVGKKLGKSRMIELHNNYVEGI